MKKISFSLATILSLTVALFSKSIFAESKIDSEQSECDKAREQVLDGNWATEMHIPDQEGDDLVLVWHDEGSIYTTGTEDPRVDKEGQPQLTYAQELGLLDKFPNCNLSTPEGV